MVTACIVLLYISYAIPVTCLLIRGRDSIPHGPFWLGKFGLFANIVLLLWTLFTLVMYSFPVVMPVLPGSEFPFPFLFAHFRWRVLMAAKT
jgi:choline transport protein